MKGFSSIFAAILLIPSAAAAGAPRGVAGLSAEFGGDRLLQLTYSDGSKSNVLVGQGVCLLGGVGAQDVLALGPVAVDLQATLGVKYSSIREASNADANFFRFPLELLVFGRWKGLRLGAGPAFHFANSFSGSGQLASYSVHFDNALGATTELDYVGEHWGIGARYTAIEYTPDVAGLGRKSGSNFGFQVTYLFGPAPAPRAAVTPPPEGTSAPPAPPAAAPAPGP